MSIAVFCGSLSTGGILCGQGHGQPDPGSWDIKKALVFKENHVEIWGRQTEVSKRPRRKKSSCETEAGHV